MLDEQISDDDMALLHEALAHPTRIRILRLLRSRPTIDVRALRTRLEERGITLDATGLQYHLRKMERAFILDVRRQSGTEHVLLLRDVLLRTKIAPAGSHTGPS